jgi:parallel beta-helix repeat protein
LSVIALGGPNFEGPEIAEGAVGTTVGSAQYAVPAGAIVVSPSGNDSAGGTQSAPLKTLARAVSVAPTGATIVLRAGTYHESVVVHKQLTIQSWPGEAVWLDGSIPVSSWAASGGRWSAGWTLEFDSSPTYTRGAPDNAGNWGFINPAYPMAAHPEQIFINGVAQRQVGALSQVVAGTFFHDEAGNKLWLGTDPTGKDVRVSELIRALMLRADNIVVRGIGIRRYSPSVPDMGAVTVERGGITVENVAIHDSSTTALHAGSSTVANVTLRNLHLARSGMLGMSGAYADGIVLDQVLSEDNNVEHFNSAPVSGGVKIARTRGITVKNSIVRNNLGPGLWFDESSYDVNVLNNEVVNNGKHGISLEISSKAKVQGNIVSDNAGFGIKINNTSNVTLAGNTFVGNDRSINIVEDSRRPTSVNSVGRDKRQAFPDPTMTWVTGPVAVSNNVVSNQRSGNCMLCVEDYTYKRTAAQMGITANGDTYVRPSSSNPKWLVVWSNGAGNPLGFTTLTSFRSTTGQEATGQLIEGGAPPPPTTTTTRPPTTTTRPPTTTTQPPSTTTPTNPPGTTTPTTAPASGKFASDSFARTVTNGFGSADIGGAWSLYGPASNFSVSSGTGRIQGVVAESTAASLDEIDLAEVDLTADLELDRAPSGGGAYVSLIGREVADGTDYRLKVRYTTGGGVSAYLSRTVNGFETTLAGTTLTGLKLADGDVVRARLVVTGSGDSATVRARVWRRGDPLPSGWLLSATDATPPVLRHPGGVGLLLYVSQSWAGGAPAITVDNVVVR